VTMTDNGLQPQGGATVSADAIVTLPDGNTATVQELIQGNMRTADYTRKTQELANERKLAERGTTLLNALDQNPSEAIALIARTYGVSAPAAAPVAQPTVDEFGQPIEQTGPTPRELELQQTVQRLEGQVVSVAQQQQRDALLGEVSRLETVHGDAFDREAVLKHMQANGIPSVETAFRDLVFEERNTAFVAQQALEAEQQQVIAEKRGLTGVVQAAGVPGGAVQEPEATYTEGSFRDVLTQALGDTKQEMGLESLMDPILIGT